MINHTDAKPAFNTKSPIASKQNCPGSSEQLFKPRQFCLGTIGLFVLKAGFISLRLMCWRGCAHLLDDLYRLGAVRGGDDPLLEEVRGFDVPAVGRGHVSLLANSDTWHSKLVRGNHRVSTNIFVNDIPRDDLRVLLVHAGLRDAEERLQLRAVLFHAFYRPRRPPRYAEVPAALFERGAAATQRRAGFFPWQVEHCFQLLVQLHV
jgi:hypothetical protein